MACFVRARVLSTILFALLLIALPALLLAAPNPPKPKLPPTITITRLDGTTVRGQFVSVDPLVVTVKPHLNPKEFGEPTSIPWKEIAKVSNGLTHSKVLADWKKEYPERLCTTCHGTLQQTCDVCKGTGHDPESAKDCATCSGELLTDCKAPGCDKGKVICPAPCIRLSQGNWIKKPDGLRWKRMPVGKGFAEISERHLGEIIIVDPGTGAPDFRGKCTLCGGTSLADCPTCHGSDKVPCPECIGRTEAPPCPEHCEKGQKPCTTCDGTGMKQG